MNKSDKILIIFDMFIAILDLVLAVLNFCEGYIWSGCLFTFLSVWLFTLVALLIASAKR